MSDYVLTIKVIVEADNEQAAAERGWELAAWLKRVSDVQTTQTTGLERVD